MENTALYNDNIQTAVSLSVPDFSKFLGNEGMLYLTSAAAFLIIDEKNNGVRNDETHAKILNSLRSYITAGQEPFFDLAPIWSKTMVAISIALAKKTSTIWSEFTSAEISKFNLVMKMFAYISNFGVNKDNNYKTGIALKGNYGKNWNMNYKLANVPPIIFAADYFGGQDALNKILINFDFDAILTELRNAGFNKTIDIMLTPGFRLADGTVSRSARELMMNGGKANFKTIKYGFENIVDGGSGVGVRVPYEADTYRTLADPLAILGRLTSFAYEPNERKNGDANITYSLQATTITNPDTGDIYGTTTGKKSPYKYMFTELNSADGNGIRTSAWHSAIDATIISFIVEAAKLLNIKNKKLEETFNIEMLNTVMDDLDFKLTEGYNGYSLGKKEFMDQKTAKKSGYSFGRSIWETYVIAK